MRCHQCGLENAPGTPLCARCSAVLDLPTSPAATRPELSRLPAAGEPGDTALDLRAPLGPRRRPLPTKAPEPRLAEPKSRRVAIPEGVTDPLSNPPVRGVAPLGAASEFESQTEQIQLPSRTDRPTPPWEEVIAAAPPELLLAWGAAREAEGPTAVSAPVSPLPEAPTHERSLTSLGQRPSAIAYEATDATETVSRPDSSATALDLPAVSRAALSASDAALVERTRLDLPPVRVAPDAGRARVAARPSEPAPPDSVRARVAPRPPRSVPRSPTEIDPVGPRPAELEPQRVPTETLEAVRGPGESRVMPDPGRPPSGPRAPVAPELPRAPEPRPTAASEPARPAEPRVAATVLDTPAPLARATPAEPAARVPAPPRVLAPLTKPEPHAPAPVAGASASRPEPARPGPRVDEAAPTDPRGRPEGLELPRARRIAPLATLAEAARARDSEPAPLRTAVDQPPPRLSARPTGTGDLPAPHRVPPPASARAPAEPVRVPARVAPLTTVDSPLPPFLRAPARPAPIADPLAAPSPEAAAHRTPDAPPRPLADARTAASSGPAEGSRPALSAQPLAEISALEASHDAPRAPSSPDTGALGLRPPLRAHEHDALVSPDFLHTDMALPKVRRGASEPVSPASPPLEAALSARAGTAERAPSAITSTATRDALDAASPAPSPIVPTVVGPAPPPSQSIELTFEPPTATGAPGDARSRVTAPSPLFGQIPAPSAIAAMTTATGARADTAAPTAPTSQPSRTATATSASPLPALGTAPLGSRLAPMAPSTIAAQSTITGARPGPTEAPATPPAADELPRPFVDLGGNEPTLQGTYTPELELAAPPGASPAPSTSRDPSRGAARPSGADEYEEATVGLARPGTSAAVAALVPAARSAELGPGTARPADTGPSLRDPSGATARPGSPASPSLAGSLGAHSPIPAPSTLPHSPIPAPSTLPHSPLPAGPLAGPPLGRGGLPAPGTLAPSALGAPTASPLVRGSIPPPSALPSSALGHSPIPPPSTLPSGRPGPAVSAIPAPSTLGLPPPPRPSAIPAPSTLRAPPGPARPGLPGMPVAPSPPDARPLAARAGTGPDTLDPLDLDLEAALGPASPTPVRLPGMPVPTTRAGASPEPARATRTPPLEDDTRPLLEPEGDAIDAAKVGRSPWSLIDGPREIRTSVGELLAREAALAMREVADPEARAASEPPVLPTALDAEDADESTRAAAPDDLARSGIDVGYDSGDAPLVMVARAPGESVREAALPPSAARSEERPLHAARSEERPHAARSEERPTPQTSRSDERPLHAARSEERPLHAARAEERPLHAARSEERPLHAARAEERPPLEPRARPAPLADPPRPRAEPEPPTSGVMQRPRTDDLLMQSSAPDVGGHTMLGLLAPALLGPSDPELGPDSGESTRLAPAGALAGSLASDLDLSEPPAQHTQLGVMVYGAPRRTEEPASGPRSAPGFALAPDFADDAVPPWEVRAIRSEHEPARAPSRAIEDDDFSPERTSPPDGRSRTASETPAFQPGLAEEETPMGAMSARGRDRRSIPSDDTPLLGGLDAPSARGFVLDDDAPSRVRSRLDDEVSPRAYRPSEAEPSRPHRPSEAEPSRPYRPSEPEPLAPRAARVPEPLAPRAARVPEPDAAAIRTLRAQADTAPGSAGLSEPQGRDESNLVVRARDDSDLAARATDDEVDPSAFLGLRGPRDDEPAARPLRDSPGVRARDGRREPEPRAPTPPLLRNPRVSEPSDAWRIPQDETRAMPLEELSGAPRTSTPAPALGRVPMPSFADETAPRLDAPPRTLTVASGSRLVLSHLVDLAITLGAIQGAALAGLLGPAWAAPLPSTPIALAEAVAVRPWPLVALAFVAVFTVGGALTTGLLGGTPGMLVADLRLYTRRTGRRAGPARALLRAVVALLGLALAGLGYAWAVVDRDRRALHDRVVGTLLVRRERR